MLQVVVVFAPILIAVALAVLAERIAPSRSHNTDPIRKLHALVLFSSGVLGIFILVPAGHYGVVQFTDAEAFGILNWFAVPFWLAILIGIAALDLGEWIIHYTLHRIPLLWRLHKIHHNDTSMDISTGYRFHPIETILRYCFGLLMIVIFGIPIEAIVVYGFLSIGFNAWEHANVQMPKPLRALQVIFITPELHRIHHSKDIAHTHSNFGVLLSCWDQVFGTKVMSESMEKIEYGLANDLGTENETMFEVFAKPFQKQ